MNTVSQNLTDLKSTIGAQSTLIAVSKRQPLDKVKMALESGHRTFGENRVQDACVIWPDLKASYPDTELHLIGALQTNKTRQAVEVFDVIHSLDRPKLAKSLAHEMAKQNRYLSCFIQVNTGEEEQKSGVLPHDLESLYHYCTADLHLNIIGLMCIPPVHEPAGLHFALLRKLASHHKLANLSMGMSSDYPLALKFGATHLRIGTGIFGARAPLEFP